MKYKCEECKDSGWYGDLGSGRRGNREYQLCECQQQVEYCSCGFPQSYPVPHDHDMTHRELAMKAYYTKEIARLKREVKP